jgi:hypothetical protein
MIFWVKKICNILSAYDKNIGQIKKLIVEKKIHLDAAAGRGANF